MRGPGGLFARSGAGAGCNFVIVRPLPHRLLSAWLALLVLATSVGLTAERHRCRLSGRSTVVLSLPGFTPKQDTAPAGRPCGKRRASGCCDVSHAQHKLNAQTPAASLAKWQPAPPPALPPILPPALPWAGVTPLASYPVPAVAVGYAANSSPPGQYRAGRVLLTLIHTLVV